MKRTALITGATSGIGLELTRIFARDGHNLVLVARNERGLQQLAQDLQGRHQVTVKVVPKDLTVRTAAEEIFQELNQESISIDFLVNNAGFSVFGAFAKVDLRSITDMMQVNMASLTELTRLFLDPMIERKFGRILNVASTAAFQAGPFMAVYYASKAYVLWFSEAIANELNGSGVTVTALCPGPTATEFQKRAGMEKIALGEGSVLQMMDAATVARKGYSGMMRGKSVVIPGVMNRIVAIVSQMVPRKVATQVTRKLQEERA